MNENLKGKVERALKGFELIPKSFNEVETKLLIINVDFSNYDKVKEFILFLKENKIRYNSYILDSNCTVNITILSD